MEIKELSLDINHRFDIAVKEGKILASLRLLGMSYPIEVGAAIAMGQWWYAAKQSYAPYPNGPHLLIVRPYLLHII